MEKEIEQETQQDESRAEAPEPAADAEPAAATATAEKRPAERERLAPRRREADDDESRPRYRGRGRRRPCVMCVNKMASVDYKDFGFLRRFVSDRGRMETRRKTGTCAKHQRALAQAIKRARHLALLPYTADHVRMGMSAPR